MFWSSVTIPGRPSLLLVDASGNALGWEAEFCDRLLGAFVRRGAAAVSGGSVRAADPDTLRPYVESDQFNCVLWCGRDRFSDHWAWLRANLRTPKLVALCSWEDYSPAMSQAVLGSTDLAPLALAPQTPLSPRAAGLYLLKFFAELDIHSTDSITGKMVWFSASKARELLARRKLPGRVGVRC